MLMVTEVTFMIQFFSGAHEIKRKLQGKKEEREEKENQEIRYL